MDGQYCWKKTEDIEVDLIDLLRKLCGQWKRIFVCAVLAAALLGAYGWMRDRKSSEISVSDAVQVNELTEKQSQAVADAVRLADEIKGLETYLDHSILMQLDPYHKARTIMLYSIDHAKSQKLPAITESYLNFISNGGAADALAESDSDLKIDKSCLAELLSAYQKTNNSPYQAVMETESGTLAESVFYVEITGRNVKEAETMALNLQTILEDYSVRVRKTAGNHRMQLVSSMQSVTADSGLQSQQHDKKTMLSSNRTALAAMTDTFNAEQMSAYKDAADIENLEGEEEAEIIENTGLHMKYIIIGFLGGIFAYVCVFICWYLFRDTIKSAEEMKRIYTFPVYGEILLEEKAKRKRMPDMQKAALFKTKEQVFQRIRMACKKKKMETLCAAADFSLTAREKECLAYLTEQLRDCGTVLTVAENVSGDASVWEKLEKTENVLMLCRLGNTTHQMVNDAMYFYLENGISVAGVVAFLPK